MERGKNEGNNKIPGKQMGTDRLDCRLNKRTTGLFFKNTRAGNIRIYGDNAYIFCGETLVTVIHVPANIKKDMEKMIRR